MKKRIILFGCQKIAVNCIDYISAQTNAELLTVYTYDLPLDTTYGYESVEEKCKELDIICKMPRSINKNIIEEISLNNPDYIFSIYYRKIFPKSLLQIPKYGCINIHPSILPKFRGPVPTAWAIINGEQETGVTIHFMDDGIDTGDILFQKSTIIDPEETGFEIYKRCMGIGTELFIENFNKMLTNELNPIKQKGVGSYYGKLEGKHTINWQNKAENIRNMVRIHAPPYNPIESVLYNHYFFLNKVSIIDDQKYVLQGPGKIVDIIKGHPVVACADGFLILENFDVYPKLSDKERAVYLKIGNRFD